jgi:glycosyltransferase involved in cell wall biosynthesis
MPSRRLLVVVYPYPPMPNVGANRWAAAGKYLGRLGHEVTVVTTSAFGRLPDDENRGVVRTGDLNTSPPLRKLMRRPPIPLQENGASAVEKPPPSVLTRTIVPDPSLVSWAPMALRAVRRILRRQPVDCIITSGPHEATHLVALGLGRRRPAWVADFRDGWGFQSLREAFPTAAQRKLDGALERRVVRSAGSIMAATPPIAEDLRDRFGVEASYVPNGWDPDLEGEVAAVEPVSLESNVVNLVHTGFLSAGSGRNPRPLFDALSVLVRDEPEVVARLRLVLAGRLMPEDNGLVSRPELSTVVRYLGALSRTQALALQRRADGLLLVTSRQSGEATGKIFEYLASGKPILALADGNVAARIVQETGTGVTVPPEDVDGIAIALKRAAAGELERFYQPRGLERYRYPELTQLFVEQIERAIARREA